MGSNVDSTNNFPLKKMILSRQQSEQWIPPSGNILKVNVDAACDLNKGCTELGVVIRDASGRLKGVVLHNASGRLSPMAGEALAILFGTRFYIKEGFKNIIMKSDALNVIEAIKQSSYNLNEIGAVTAEVHCLKHAFDMISWSKISRTCNKAAHNLAKKALHITGKGGKWA
ncbi:uncharacterized protein LOC126792234 [Argentina anserina]|uniref:uncharacterized protein LOC126792234 n=1 Tax=Argentina anserina TaxID=57926 RepID=UPI00217632F9|nr:uncharacterized protein LOC126792234 [Potentilla anserina]